MFQEEELYKQFSKLPFEYYYDQRFDYYKQAHPKMSEITIQNQIVFEWLDLPLYKREAYEHTRKQTQNQVLESLKLLSLEPKKSQIRNPTNLKFQLNYCCSKKNFQIQAKDLQNTLHKRFPTTECDIYQIGGFSEEVALYGICDESVDLIWHSHFDVYADNETIIKKIEYLYFNQ